MMKLTEVSHLQFEKLVSKHAPPAARHLKHLFDAQLRALKIKSLRTYWHEEILNWCAKIFRKDRGAYELMWSGQMLLLPHPDTIRKRCAAHYARPGNDDDRYETIRSEMAEFSEIDRNVAVKFDEINTRADLVWKERGGEFELFGLAEVIIGSRMYGDSTAEPTITDKVSTHALAFQVESLTRKYRRICAIFPVSRLDAAGVNHFWWSVVRRLTHLCSLRVRAAVGDGAGSNRLFFKGNITDGMLGFGSQNLVLEGRAWMWNLASPGGKIFVIPNLSHGAKKAINNLEGSHVGRDEKRRLLLPELLVDAIPSSIPPLFDFLPPTIESGGVGPGEDTRGEEAYLYVMRRIYDLMNSHQPYVAGEQQREPRLLELRFLLKWLLAWRKYNDIVDVGHHVSPTERAKWGLSHQLNFDFECAMEGFIGLINAMVSEYGTGRVAVRGRALNQDTLESMFSSLRYLCGGGSDPSVYQVMQGVQPAEEQRRDKQQVTLSRKRKSNSGVNDCEVPTHRREDTARYDNEPPQPNEATGPEEGVILWALHEPADFDLQLQQLLQPGARPSIAYEVSWGRIRRVQAMGRDYKWPASHDAVALQQALQP